MSPLPGSTDGNPIKNVTSRKKTRPKPVDDDSDYEISGSSSAKKKRYNRINAHGAGPSSRRKLNLSFLPTETKKKEHGKGREAESNDGESLETAVHKILGSHLMLRKFLNSNNCFEHKTVLDIINNEIVRNESMADMAMILNSAVEVYGFRVDRCYLHVQDTRGHITSSFNAKHNNELHNDPIRGSPKRRKRDDIKQNIGDWKARLNEDGEHELDIANEDEDEGSGRRHIPEEDSEIFLDNIPSNREELSSFLDDLMEQRKNINDKIHSTNTHIVENGDDLMDKTNKELSSNEYYQKAVSRYGEGNSAAMLMNNAKFSSESHAYLIHSRIIANETKTVESLSYDFIKQVKSTLANSLSAAPKKIENDLLPAINEVYHNSDEETDEEDNFTATAADEFIEPCAQTENIPRSPKSKTSELRRSIIFRGKNMTIERTWVADDAELHLAADLYSDNDKEDFSRFENYRRDGVHQEEKGKLPPELELSTADLKDRSKYFELSGIDEDVRELDNLWNSQIVKNVVTAEQTAEMIRFVENSEDSPEEIHNKKLRILQPGDYVFFVGNTTEENPLIPVDSWREEGAEPALDVGGDDVFYDAEDDFGEIGEYEDLPNGTETNNISVTNSPFDAESVMDDVRLAMERETPIEDGDIGETVKLEDIADVPVNPGMIPDKPDEAIRNLGKEDNAHWKGSKNAETLAGDIKKQKKSRMLEEKSTTTDEYWAPSDAEMRRRALNKYSARPSTSVEREDALIFHPRPPKRAVFDLYNFEDFNKVSCLDGEIALSGNSWDRSLRKKHLLDKHLSLYDVPTFNEDGDESMGIEWMRALRGFRLRKTADEQQLAAPEDDSALPIASSMDDHVSDDDDGMEYSLDVENLLHDHNYEDHIKYDVDSPGVESYHTAPPGSNSPDQDFNQAIETLPWMTRKNKLQEIRELQAAEDIEEEGEIAEGLEGGTAIIIRNTSIDQSKVKSYLKNILTNRMMDKKCLKTVIEAANDHDYLDQTVAAVRELTLMNPGQDISMMNRSFEFKDTGIDPLEVSRIVFTTPDQATQTGQGLNTSTNQDGPSQEALTNAVVLSDFNIEGDHSLSSIMGCLPFRAQRSNEKNMHVALLFSIALQMCNENTLHCQQSSSNQESNWMGDFLLTNGSASQVKAPVDISRSKRPMRIMQEVIPEVDEPLDDSTLQ